MLVDWKYFFLNDGFIFLLRVIRASKEFSEILDTSDVYTYGEILIPFLKLDDIVGADMKAFEFGFVDLHYDFHHPAKVFFVL